MNKNEDFSTKSLVQSRPSLKTHHNFNHNDGWKLKLRENCYKRVREDRKRLIWKMRVAPNSQPLDYDSKGLIQSAFEDIVSDELTKLKHISRDANSKLRASGQVDDMLWEYDGLHEAYQGNCEGILLEMQRIFYEDLNPDSNLNELESYLETWEAEEDEYLASAVYEHMRLNENPPKAVIWCPICKHGELEENNDCIHCSVCKVELKTDDKVDLALLQVRLAEVHTEHLDRGCTLKPRFCLETRFGIKALYIICTGCSTFEVVI